jgi:hypothetical protein
LTRTIEITFSFDAIHLIQDELETMLFCPILSISERNLAFMGVGRIPRIQLASVALRYAEHVISGRIFPGRFLGEMVTIPMKPPSIVFA